MNCTSVKFFNLTEKTTDKENEAQTVEKLRPPACEDWHCDCTVWKDVVIGITVG